MKNIYFCVTMLFLSLKSFSCSCPVPSLEDQVNGSDLIYIGTVTSARTINEGKDIEAVLKVHRVLKGELSSTTSKILTSTLGCERVITINTTYIIQNRKQGNDLSPRIGGCDGSFPIGRLYEEEYAQKVNEITQKKNNQ